jgi:hypothetical protein
LFVRAVPKVTGASRPLRYDDRATTTGDPRDEQYDSGIPTPHGFDRTSRLPCFAREARPSQCGDQSDFNEPENAEDKEGEDSSA